MKAKLLLILLVFLPLIGCDRYTKLEAIAHLKGQDPISFMNGLFYLTYHENTGAMLSLGAKLPDNWRFFIFTVLVGLFLLAGLLYVLFKPLDKYTYTIGLLVLAGGIGNLYDRAFYDGSVVDFMLIKLGPVQTGVFNIADVAIMAGLFGFIFLSTKWGEKLTGKVSSEQ